MNRPEKSIPLVVLWHEPSDPEWLGGKGAGLREVGAQGLSVPPWIALTTAAFDAVLAPVRDQVNEILSRISAGSLSARHGSALLADVLRETMWPSDLSVALDCRLLRIRTANGLAVRSSLVGEDGARSSFAGQLSTRLFVPLRGVKDAVRDCWISAFSEHAILYRRRMAGSGGSEMPGLPGDIRMAVIIQEMVESTASGIACTADPVTGIRRDVVVAGLGLGEGVVHDLVETDHYVRRSPGSEWSIRVGHKHRRVVRRRD